MSTVSQDSPVIEKIELTQIFPKGELAVFDRGEEESEPGHRFWPRYGLFLLTIALPVFLGALYFFAIEAPRYESEAHFVVRSSSSASQGAGISALIANEGMSRATDETYAVADYLTSRDAALLLERNNALREILSRPEADFIGRYPNFYTRENAENLYRRYRSMVSARIDGATGISIVKVTAFRPEDARSLAAAILKYAEGLINQLNERAYGDAERYAQTVVDSERMRVEAIESQLTQYRNASETVDPGKEAIANFELVGRMTAELALLQAQVTQQFAVAPNDPNLPAMRQRVAAYQAEIDKQKRLIVGSNGSLASKLDGFERLMFERELAGRALAMAMASLTKAREDAYQQHLYLQTVVEPHLADERDYWRIFSGMGAVFLLSCAAFVIARTAGFIVLEHSG